MGGSKKYLSEGGFSEQTYRQVGTTSNGIKIIEKIDNKSSNTPINSNTPYTMYAANDSHSGELKQISVYGGQDGRTKIKDIDYGHEHINTNGKRFAENEIHVQLYNGTERLTDARKPSKKERRLMMMALYGRV